MKSLFSKISATAVEHPNKIAIRSTKQQLSFQDMKQRIKQLSHHLQKTGLKRIALYMDNCIDWIVLDLACLHSGLTLIPIPLFFSDEQITHLVENAGIQAIITASGQISPIVADAYLQIPNTNSQLNIIRHKDKIIPASIAKVTYTSGSTGSPKGVCLSVKNLESVSNSIVSSMDELNLEDHICTMPLATLLENIAGVYVPLMRGGSITVLPLNDLGFRSNSEFDMQSLVNAVDQYPVDSMILLPHLLKQALSYKKRDKTAFKHLKFIAVGGGKTSRKIIEEAIENELPVCEGYGLSECASVVSLNLPSQNRPGSVGKALPHAQVSIAFDGEILIQGQAMQGYLGELDNPPTIIHTGDYGRIDNEGFIYISGRKKNVIVSSFGRNISPEWVEAEILQSDHISQVVVFGDAQTCLSAVVIPSSKNVSANDIQYSINTSNALLPDYAQVKYWLIGTESFSTLNNMLTDNGRPKREVIYQTYQERINRLYA